MAPALSGPRPGGPGGPGEPYERGSRARPLPQSEPFFSKHESRHHRAAFKGFDFYLGARGRHCRGGHPKKGRCESIFVLRQVSGSTARPHSLGTGRGGWRKLVSLCLWLHIPSPEDGNIFIWGFFFCIWSFPDGMEV